MVVLRIRNTLPCVAGADTVVASFNAARQFPYPTGLGLHFAHKGEGGSGLGISHVIDPKLRRWVLHCIRNTLPCMAGANTVVALFYGARQLTNPMGIGLHFA